MLMIAQFVFTPAESKRLIAKAILELDIVKKALNKGMVVIHPSSTTSFIMLEKTGQWPKGIWACGIVEPKGTCISYERYLLGKEKRELGKTDFGDPLDFLYSWVFKNGVLQDKIKLGTILEEIDIEDVYIKTGNTLDVEGRVGVLFGRKGGGTIGRVIKAARKKKFNIVIPIGLEKLIPTKLQDAVKGVKINKIDYAMGIPVGLIPIPGITVTEISALNVLAGVKATAIASGGIKGAEGATIITIEGSPTQVQKAIKIVESVKGASLPQTPSSNCQDCTFPGCHFRGKRQIS